MSFIDSIYEKAKADVKTIAIPEYDNDYMMKAAVKAHHDGIANILLVAPPPRYRRGRTSWAWTSPASPLLTRGTRPLSAPFWIAMPPCRRK